MKIATSELEHLREEVKNCHRIIKDLQKKREFVGLTDEEFTRIQKETPYTQFMTVSEYALQCQIKHEAKLKELNT